MTITEIKKTLRGYPDLKLKKYPTRIEGSLHISDADGLILENFKVKILLYQNSFRTAFPRVFELTQKLPREADRHVYNTGELCLATPFKQAITYRNRTIELKEFLDDVLSPFFANQLLIKEGYTKKFIQGERSHGTLGVAEEYMAFWMITTPEEVVARLKAYLKKNGNNLPCFCSSGLKYKRCHQEEVQKIDFVDRDLLKNDLKQLTDWITEGKPASETINQSLTREHL